MQIPITVEGPYRNRYHRAVQWARACVWMLVCAACGIALGVGLS